MNIELLRADVRSRMKERHISLQEAATQIGVSAPTLSRLLAHRGETMTIESFELIVNWLSSDVRLYFHPVCYDDPDTWKQLQIALFTVGVPEKIAEAILVLARLAGEPYAKTRNV